MRQNTRSAKTPEPALVRAYQESLAPEMIRQIRLLALLVGALNFGFVALDYLLISKGWTPVLTVRMLLGALLTIGFLSTWSDRFNRLYPTVTSALILGIGFSICAMIHLAQPQDVARETYYAGLLIVTFSTYTLTFLSARRLAAISALLACAYITATQGEPSAALATQLFLYLSCVVVGMAAAQARHRHAWENFQFRHALEQDAIKKEEEVERIAHLAEHDALTGLPNRTRFYKEAQALLRDAAQCHQQLAILFIDLNGFKPINDTHGHAAGDRVLVAIADRLRQNLRAEDRLARIGGDEFVVAAVIDDDRPSSLPAITRHLAEQIRVPVRVRDQTVSVSASIGLALYPKDGANLNALLASADDDMYRVKAQLRDSVPAMAELSIPA